VVNIIRAVNLGCTDYKECWDLQQQLLERRLAEEVGDLLLLTEHDHVYTIGKSGDDNHLLASREDLRSDGVAVYHNDRGGDITYHGPGQVVGYPILDLKNYYLDLHRYLRDIEEVIIRTLIHYGVNGVRDSAYTGVWVGNDKICAIGVKTSRWVTMHGFAFNINTNLSYFSKIVPCGILGKGVTSLAQVFGHEVDMNEVSHRLVESFGEVFGAEVRSVDQNTVRVETSVPDEVIP
jgi:lipoyl(octanoyl) transferase